MWSFCLFSLFREYGWQFVWRVALRHPVKTLRAVTTSGKLDFSTGTTVVGNEPSHPPLEGEKSIVGVGFCLKPTTPACPSGRSNHECYYLEHLIHRENAATPPACHQCAIRDIGSIALKAGTAFYVMTSAKDILFDVFTPAIADKRFSSGLFVLCRYSMRPFAVGLRVSGIHGWLLSYESGDCCDYGTWLLADRGIKEERTEIDRPSQTAITEILALAAEASKPGDKFEKRGSVFYPRIAANRDLRHRDTGNTVGCHAHPKRSGGWACFTSYFSTQRREGAKTQRTL